MVGKLRNLLGKLAHGRAQKGRPISSPGGTHERFRRDILLVAHRATATGYGFGEALGEEEAAGLDDAAADGVGDVSVFGEVFFSCAAFSASVIGPSFMVFASSVPSASFQYEPRTSSFATTSFIVAAAPAFERTVLSVILKTRDFSLPAIVNVFAF
jgi:hypothetical protein